MTVMINGVKYEPARAPLPAWKHGHIADVFMNKTFEQLGREPNTWSCDTIDIIGRVSAYKTALSALLWYRDECGRLRERLKQAGVVDL